MSKAGATFESSNIASALAPKLRTIHQERDRKMKEARLKANEEECERAGADMKKPGKRRNEELQEQQEKAKGKTNESKNV
jgi:hypothetical protein